MPAKDFLISSSCLKVAASCILPISAILAAFPVMALNLSPSEQTGLDLGSAGNYALVDEGSGTTLGFNSGPNIGDVLLGNNVNAAFSGGGNGQISGTLFYDSTVTGTNTFSQLQTPPTTKLISSAFGPQVIASAQSVSNYASSLAATQTYGDITGTTTIKGNGGLNVIDVSNIQNAPLTISGGSNDFFVVNVSGQVQTNRAMTLSGVNPSQVLFNLTGTGNVFQTSGGDVSYGTYLATNGGKFQFSNLDLTGSLINTAGNVQFVSGSKMIYAPTKVPEPENILGSLIAIGFLAGGMKMQKRRKLKLAQNVSARANVIG